MKRLLSYLTLLVLLGFLGLSDAMAAAPSVQARYVTFTGVTSNSVTVSWLNGNGDGRVLILEAGAGPVNVPSGAGNATNNAWVWNAQANLTGFTGTRINDAGALNATGAGYVMYKGNGRTVTLTGLNPATQYSVKVIEYNNVGVAIDLNTADGTPSNPRTFTTANAVATVNAPTALAATSVGPVATLTWNQAAGHTAATSYYLTIEKKQIDDSYAAVTAYENLDIGVLGATATESFEAFITEAGTYRYKVQAIHNGVASSWATSSDFAILNVTTPSFVQTGITMAAGEMYLDVVFDQEVTSNPTGAAAYLELADFAIYDFTPTPVGTATAVAIRAIENISPTTYRLHLNVTGRASGAETFKVSAANNYSIFGRNGLAINPTSGTNYRTPYVALNVMNVLVSDGFSYTTINKAVDAAETDAGETIEIAGSQTATADVTIADANLTITGTSLDLNGHNIIFTTPATYSVDYTSNIGGFVLNGGFAVSITGTERISYNGTEPLFRAPLSATPVWNITNNTDIRLTNSTAAQYLVSNEGGDLGAFTFTGNTVSANHDNSVALNFTVANDDADFNVAFAITGNTFGTTTNGKKGTAVKFIDPAGTQTKDMSGATVTIANNAFNNTGYAIAFSGNDQLASAMPIIDLTTGGVNTYHADNTGIPSGYVFSDATLAASHYLYPGIAVLKTDADGNLTSTTNASAKNTVLEAITAAANDATQTIYLGKGTYADAIALNKAVDLVGKGNVAATGTTITGVVTASATAAGYTVSQILFDAANTNSIVLSATPDAAGVMITDCNFNYQDGDVAVNITDKSIANDITFDGNTFTKTAGTNLGTAIGLFDNQIAGDVTITSNFIAEAGATNALAIHVSTSNSTAENSSGNLTINSCVFDPLNGDAIVFEDLVNANINNKTLADAAIIIDQNNFSQTGYGIKILDNATYAAAIHTTLPETIDLRDAGANTNFTADDVYGAAWFTLATADATDLLYPSLQAIENASDDVPAAPVNFYIGAGTYNEDLTFAGIDAAAQITVTGYGSVCELGATNTLTLSQDVNFVRDVDGKGLFAANVVMDHTDASIEDAFVVVKPNGVISIGNATITDATATLAKAGVTVQGTHANATLSGALTINANNTTIKNLIFSNNGNKLVLNPTTALDGINISNNTFSGTALGFAISTADAKSYTNLNISSNTFAMNDNAAQNVSIKLGRSIYNGVNNIHSNTFNFDGGSAATPAGSDYGIWLEGSNAAANSTGTLNIYANNFVGGAGLDDETIAIGFRNTADGDFKNFGTINVFNGNTFANDGYSCYLVNENSSCEVFDTPISLYGTSPNTFTIGTATNNLVLEHFKGFNYVPDLTAPGAALTPLCNAPAGFDVTTVTTTTNPVTGYWNSNNTHLTVRVKIKSANVLYGQVQLLATELVDPDDWSDIDPTNLVDNKIYYLGTNNQIVQADVDNGYKDITISKATFEALHGFLEDDEWKFNAIITNYAGMSTTGTESVQTLTVDQTAPTVTWALPATAPFVGGVITLTENGSLITTNATASENGTKLYFFNNTDYAAPTFLTLPNARLTSSANTYNGTAVGVTIPADLDRATYHGKTCKIVGVDAAGNVGTAYSAGAFVFNLKTPFAPTAIAEHGTTKTADGYYNLTESGTPTTVRVTFSNVAESSTEKPVAAGDIVKLYTGSSVGTLSKTSAALVAQDIINGYIDFSLASGDLPDGAHILKATVENSAATGGNTSAKSIANLSFTSDKTRPIISSVKLNGENKINASNYTNVPFTFSATEAGTYSFTISSNNGGANVTGTNLNATSGSNSRTGNNTTSLNDGTLTLTINMTDIAGNTANPAGTDTEEKGIIAPAGFPTGAVAAITANEAGTQHLAYTGYFNAGNDINVTVPVANDAAKLTGGKIQLRAKKDNGEWFNIGTLYTIAAGDINANKTLSITRTQLAALTGDNAISHGSVWSFNAVITDKFGNSVTGTASTSTLRCVLDAVAAKSPTATTTGTILVANYFNSTNTGINVETALAATDYANGGTLTLQYRTSNESAFTSDPIWTNFTGAGTYTDLAITPAEVTALKKVINVTSADFLALVAEGRYVQFRTVLKNASNLASNSNPTIYRRRDITVPTIESITSTTPDGNYGVGATINFTVNLTEAAVFTATGTGSAIREARLLLNNGTNAVRNSSKTSNQSLEFTYTVAANNTSADLAWANNTTITTHTSLDGVCNWRDIAGNPVNLNTNVLVTPNTQAEFLTDHAIVVDATALACGIQYYLGSVVGNPQGVNPYLKVTNDLWLKVKFNKAIKAGTTPKINITGTTGNNVTNGNLILHDAVNNIWSYNRIVTANETDNGSQEIIKITATDIYDNTITNATPTLAVAGYGAAWNGTLTATTNTYQGKVDAKSPTATITFDRSNPTNEDEITATINFGESVQNFTAANVTVSKTGTGAVAKGVLTPNGDNSSFTLPLTVTGTSGVITVSVPNGTEGVGGNNMMDAAGNLVIGDLKTITYDVDVPTVSITGGSVIWSGTDKMIALIGNNGTSNVTSLHWTIDGSPVNMAVANFTGDSKPLTTSLLFNTSGEYTINLRAKNAAGNETPLANQATATVRIDKTQPVIAANTINNLGIVNTGNPATITWVAANLADAHSGIKPNSVRFQYTTDNSLPDASEVVWTNLALNEANDGTLTWNVPAGISSTNCQLRMLVEDNVNLASAWRYGNTFTITSVLGVSVQPEDVLSCSTPVNATISAEFAGGVPPYTFAWEYNNAGTWASVSNGTPANATYTITNNNGITTLSVGGNIAAGDYEFRAKANGTVITDVATLTVSAAPVAATSITKSVDNYCAGEVNEVTLTANGGVGTTIEWSADNFETILSHNASFTINPAPTATTTYKVRYSNTCGTSAERSTDVTVYALPLAPVATAQAFCASTNPRVSNLVPAIGLTTRWYNVPNGGTPLNATTLLVTGTNTYYVASVSAEGCEGTRTPVEVRVNASYTPTVAITSSAITNIACINSPVTFTATTADTRGAVIAYKWLLNDVEIEGANAATYTTSTLATGDRVKCEIELTGGDCLASQTATSNVITTTVSVSPITGLSVTGTTTICHNGTAVISVLNTQNGVSYELRNGNVTIGAAKLGNGATQTFTVAGITENTTYNVLATIAGGCSVQLDQTAVITVSPAATASITAGGSTTFCTGGSVLLTANEGAGYQWKKNGTNVPGATSRTYSATTAGAYTVVVTNSTGCQATSAATNVTVNTATVATITPAAGHASLTFCNGGSVTLTANAGMTAYSWSNGATTQSITVTEGGTYTVTITNANGCTSTANRTVTVTTPTASITASGSTNVCVGDELTLTASDGASYLWSNGAQTKTITVSTVAAGTSNYYVAVTNANGCTATSATTTVTVNALPTATITVAGQTTYCLGSSATLTASEGASYQWKVSETNDIDDAEDIESATSRTYMIPVDQPADVYYYFVEVTNAAGCVATSASTMITINTPPTATVTPAAGAASLTFCAGGSVTLTAATVTGATYLWSNGATTPAITVTAGGDYHVTVTKNGCSTTSSVRRVIVNPLPTVAAGANQTTCGLAPVEITGAAVTGQTSIAWTKTGGNGTLTNTTALVPTYTPVASDFGTTITLTLTATNGCGANLATKTLSINAPFEPTITAGGETSFCAGGSVTLTASAGASYLWSNGATTQTINATTAGDYSVTVTNAAGCSATTAVVPVSVLANPVVLTASATPAIICGSGNVTFTATANNGTITWYDAALGGNVVPNVTNIPVSANTTYYAQASNACNTSARTAVSVTVNAIPAAPTASVVNNCNGTSTVTVTATGTIAVTAPAGAVVSNVGNVYTVNVAGEYLFTQTVDGCVSAAATAVAAPKTAPLAPAVSVVNNCNGTSTITVTATGTIAVTAPVGAVVSNVGNVYTVNMAGEYLFTQTVDGCVSAAATAVAAPGTTPVVTLALARTTALDNEAAFALAGGLPAGGTYSGTGVVAGNFNPAVAGVGTHTITYTVTNGACTASATQDIVVTAGVVEYAEALQVVDVIGKKESGIAFNVTVRSLFGANLAPVDGDKTVTLAYGGQTFTGTIEDGTNSVVIPVTLNIADGAVGVTLTATATDLTSDESNEFTVIAAEPTAPLTIARGLRSRDWINISWTKANVNDKVMLVGVQANNIDVLNLDGSASTFAGANASFTTAATVAGVKVLYMGSDLNSIRVTDLTRNINGAGIYTFAVYTYNGTTNTWNFSSTRQVTTTNTLSKELTETETGNDFVSESFSVSTVAPNPVKDQVNFTVNALTDANFTVELFNANGETVLTQTQFFNAGSHSLSLDLFTQKGMLAAGSYFLRVTAEGETLTQPVVVMP